MKVWENVRTGGVDEAGVGRVVASRSVNRRVITRRVASDNKQGRNPYRRVCDRVHRRRWKGSRRV